MPKIKNEELQLGAIKKEKVISPRDGVSIFTSSDEKLYLKRAGSEGLFSIPTSEDMNQIVETETISALNKLAGNGLSISNDIFGIDKDFRLYLATMTFKKPSIKKFEVINADIGYVEPGWSHTINNFSFKHSEENIENITSLQLLKMSGNETSILLDDIKPSNIEAIVKCDFNDSFISDFINEKSYSYVLRANYRTPDSKEYIVDEKLSTHTTHYVFFGKSQKDLETLEDLNFFIAFSLKDTFEISGQSEKNYAWICFEENSDPIKSNTIFRNMETGFPIPFFKAKTDILYTNKYSNTTKYNCYRSVSLINSDIKIGIEGGVYGKN